MHPFIFACVIRYQEQLQASYAETFGEEDKWEPLFFKKPGDWLRFEKERPKLLVTRAISLREKTNHPPTTGQE